MRKIRKARERKPVLQLFERHFKKTEGCWNWEGAISQSSGYGTFSNRRKTYTAHRMSYMLYKGEVPAGMILCHSCDNRRCVNPDHLSPGTCKDNIQDASKKGRLIRKKPRTPKEKAEMLLGLISAGRSVKSVAEEFNMNYRTLMYMAVRERCKAEALRQAA